MIRKFYKGQEGRTRVRPLFLSFYLFCFTLLLLFFVLHLNVFFSVSKIFIGLLGLLVLVTFCILIFAFVKAERVPKIEVPSMTLKGKLIAKKIKSEFKPLVAVNLFKITKTTYGFPLPGVEVFVDENCFSGWVAVENAYSFNRLDSDEVLEDMGGLLEKKSLRKFSFISSELSQDANFYLFHFEDTSTSQRFLIKDDDLTPFISKNEHNIKLAKNLTWDASGSTPHMALIGRTRSGKSYFVGHYLLPLMLLQGWHVEFFSVKNDIFVDEFQGEFEPDKIIVRLEHWVMVMKDRNQQIKKAGKEKYTQVQGMSDVCLAIDELGSFNGFVNIDRKLKARWESAIGALTATGASAGIHVLAMSQYGTKESFLPTTARANVLDCSIVLGMAADSGKDREYIFPTFEISHRTYATGQGLARVVSAGELWEKPHFFETPLFTDKK